MISPLIQDLINFLDQSPTAWHAVSIAKSRLLQNGFLELNEQDTWNIQANQAYVVTRNDSSLCAFVTPRELPKRIRLFASHTDSPSLKLKPRPEIRKHQAILLGVEIYGSPLLSTWLNRDLGIAGKILYRNSSGQIHEQLVCLDKHPLIIPQLAIHLDREVNEKGLILNKQEHLNALAGLDPSLSASSFLDTILRESFDMHQLISHDLFLFPLEKTRLIGFNQKLLAAYRIDSLASVHAGLSALLQKPESLKDEIKMIIFWDNEEIGSQTAQGAQSTFFNHTTERIFDSYQGRREDYFRMLSLSVCISIDLAHALHPNHSDKHDPQHQPILGQGIVLKSNSQQRYATTARSALPVELIASQNQLSLQKFVSRNDIPCGTTIGPLHAFHTGMSTADIGCGQLSMHACREIMACEDHLDMCKLLESLMENTPWPTIQEN